MLRDRLFVALLSLTLFFAAAAHGAAAADEAAALSRSEPHADVAFAGTLGGYGVVLLSEGTPRLHLTVSGLAAGAPVLVAYSVADALGTQRLSGEERAAAEGEATLSIDLSSLAPGWYRISYTLAGDGLPAQRGTRDFVILSGRAPAGAEARLHNPFGIKNERLADYEAALIHHLGAGWVFDAATPTWSEVQFRSGGALVWRARSQARLSAAAYGLIPVGHVGAPPDWLGEAGIASAAGLEDFIGFVRAFAREVGAPYIVSAGPSGGAVATAAQAKAAAAGLARGTSRPALNVVALDPGADVTGLLALGVQYHTDALLFELPRLTAPPEQFDWQALRRVQRQWNAAGGRADLWVILPNPPAFESAAKSAASAGAFSTGAEPLRLNGAALSAAGDPGVAAVPGDADGLRQAQWLVRAHVLLLAHGADRIFADPLSTGPSEYRMYSGGAGAYPDQTYRPRPAVAAYAALTEQLAGATYLGRLHMPADIRAYAFAREGQLVLVVWSTRPRSVELNNVSVPAVQVTDMFGAVQTVPVSGGRLTLQVDESPRYVAGLDLGVLAQVLVDDVEDRMRAYPALFGPPPGDVSPERLADLVYDLATLMWLHQVGADRSGELAALWYRGLEWMLGLADALAKAARAGDGAAQAGMYEVYEWLAIMAEVGGLIGAVGDPEERPLQIAGGTALLAEAQAALDALRADHAADAPHAERLMRRLTGWWQRIQAAPDAVRAPWAIVVREAAALAVEHGLAEPRLAPGVFALVPQTELDRPYAGFNPFLSTFESLQSLLSDLGRLIVSSIPVPGAAERKAAGTVEPAPLGEAGWDEVPLGMRVINGGDGREALLALEAPEGWFWRVGAQLIEAGGEIAIALAVPAAGQDAAETELAVSLLIPYDAEPGVYTASVTLLSGAGIHDRLTFTVRVAQAPTPVAAPSSKRGSS